MSTKSLVLKSTVFPEWYADRRSCFHRADPAFADARPVIPWYHYIPVKVDYSDLYDSPLPRMLRSESDSRPVMAFFVGTPGGEGSHDRIAYRLAENGRHWAQRYWRRADMARCAS
jgi:hypothetical protein